MTLNYTICSVFLISSNVRRRYCRLQLIWADGGYRGKLIAWTKTVLNCILEIVKRNDDVKGFQVLPQRWIVERTFGWLGNYRRLSKEYEILPETSEAMIYAAMIHIMTRRLARSTVIRAP